MTDNPSASTGSPPPTPPPAAPAAGQPATPASPAAAVTPPAAPAATPPAEPPGEPRNWMTTAGNVLMVGACGALVIVLLDLAFKGKILRPVFAALGLEPAAEDAEAAATPEGGS